MLLLLLFSDQVSWFSTIDKGSFVVVVVVVVCGE